MSTRQYNRGQYSRLRRGPVGLCSGGPSQEDQEFQRKIDIEQIRKANRLSVHQDNYDNVSKASSLIDFGGKGDLSESDVAIGSPFTRGGDRENMFLEISNCL